MLDYATGDVRWREGKRRRLDVVNAGPDVQRRCRRRHILFMSENGRGVAPSLKRMEDEVTAFLACPFFHGPEESC